MARSSNETGWTRREAIRGLGALLVAGAWPGWARAAEAGEFSFAVANDFHHDGPGCDFWFERLFRQIAAHPGAVFCAGLGDLAHRGRPESIAAIARIAAAAGVTLYPVPGNHDNDLDGSPFNYAQVLPGRLNYHWTHAGWQFVAIDTTDGKKATFTRVSARTLAWLDATLPQLDPARPTVLCTHFPLLPISVVTPANAEDVLARFERMNLRGVFCGHYHGKRTARRGAYELVTDVCCSRVAKNHDGSPEKGYWLCRARGDGTIERSFVAFAV